VTTAKRSTAKKTAAKKTTSGVPEAPAPVDQPPAPTPDAEDGAAKLKAAKKPEIGSPAWQRADRIRALEEERRGYEQRGLKDRIAEVDAQLKLAKSSVKDRSEPPSDKA